MQTVLAIQAIAGSLYLLTIAVVGFRLVHLAYKSRGLPELLLGAGMILGGVFGGPLEGAGVSATPELGPTIAGRMILVGKILSVVGVTSHTCFIWRVFRPQTRWAMALVAVIVGLLLAGFVGYWINGTYVTGEISLLWFWVNLLAQLGVSLWLVVEGYTYYRQMKRRLALGLADPVLCNRFLLWSLAGVATIVVLLTSIPPTFLDPDKYALLLTTDLFVFSASGVIVSILYFLTFFPPAAYRRLLQASTEAAT